MNKKLFLLFVSLISLPVFAQIRDFQTARLNSSAGAGVASILSTEAAILNPATSAFFTDSSASYQGYTTSLRKSNTLRDTVPDKFAKRNRSQGFFISDNSGPIKGGIAYLMQKENGFNRERMIAHGAAPMSASSAVGVSYSYIMDKNPSQYSPRHRIHHMATIGTSFIISEDTVLGLILVDPTRTIGGEEKVVGGIQQDITDKIAIIADAGYKYTGSINDDTLWKAALQLSLFEDFYVRIGKFYDNINHVRGTGWGASWIGPRLGLEFAQKFSEQFSKNGYTYQDETLVDTSVSAIIKF